MKKILLVLSVLVALFFVIGCTAVNEGQKEISDSLDSGSEQVGSQLNDIESQINPVRDQIIPSEKDGEGEDTTPEDGGCCLTDCTWKERTDCYGNFIAFEECELQTQCVFSCCIIGNTPIEGQMTEPECGVYSPTLGDYRYYYNMSCDDVGSDLNETDSPGEPLRVCPDEMISNQMPCACADDDCSGCDNPPRGYYILNRKRKEISEFDSEWVEENCDVKTQVVY